MEWTIIVGCGFLLDCMFGDPYEMPHFVRWIGTLIGKTENAVRGCFSKSPRGQRLAGICFVLLILTVVGAMAYSVIPLAYGIHPWLGTALEVFLCYQIFAAKSLCVESGKVYEALKVGDLQGARKAVSMIVGRDTESLDEAGVTRAAVETVAENTSDGVIAPLFFLWIGGVPLAILYKAVNTMDSMIGYQNETYRYFGTAAAKLDDVCNFFPARIGGVLMVAAAWCLGYDWKNAWKVFKRDRRNHASPNSAHTEAACAGALDLQLGGNARYFGEVHEKPTIGDAIRPIEPEDILRGQRLMYVSTLLAIVIVSGIKLL